ncbi:VirB4 family type IV secretion/conjugal transfer ATPase [Rickettsia endosymbiont of Urophora cardui]|uniref:VirB4 family type IV secretion/conjugal transfer ATPase n=2 Tax=Rickettsia endosymbiont of Urophora cardui TaxID=3066265 RepID=UPI00313EAA0E
MTKNQDFVLTWQLDGFPIECESIQNLDINNMLTHNFLRSFASENITFYVHIVRSKHHDHFEVETKNYFADRISDLYYQSLASEAFRRNRIFFTMVYSPHNIFERAAFKATSPQEQKKRIDELLKKVSEFSERISGFLERFGGRKLTTYQNAQGVVFSKQLEFFNFLISNVWQKVPVLKKPIYETFGTNDVYFANQNGQINTSMDKKFFKAIEISEFPDSTNSLSMSSLLISDCDFVLTQSFSCVSKRKSLSFINNVIKKLRASEDDALTQRDDLIDAKDELAGNEIFFGKYHFSLAIYGNSLEEAKQSANKQMSILSDLGFVAILAEFSLYGHFFSQLPAVFDLRPRLSSMASRHFVDLASFHNFESGKRDQNCWGEAVAILKTPNKQAYYLNLHESKLGKDEFGEKNNASTSVIGSTGSGKTMLLSFLQICLQKYGTEESFDQNSKSKKLTSIFLDKDRGAELNIRALGGQYCRFKHGEPTGWNPFCLEPTSTNISFITDLMELLCTLNGKPLTIRQQNELSRSVTSVMQLEIQERRYGISRLIEALNQSAELEEQDRSIAISLQKWSKDGEYGWIFDNENDEFDISSSTNFGFDGTEFLEHQKIRSPISFYILHRITEILDGRRVVIFMDEFWKWISDDVFAKFAKDKLKTIRKLNGMLIYATQSPSDILSSKLARTVVESSSTQIFLSNPKATKQDYIDGFKLTEEEYLSIANLDPASRCFLVKKSSLYGGVKPFSAIVKLDLKSLGANTKILSSSKDNLEIFEKSFEQQERPEMWIDDFLKVAV